VREPAAASAARGGGGRRIAIIGAAAVTVAAAAVVALLKLGGGAATPAPTVVTPQPLPAAAPIAAVVTPKPIEKIEVAVKSDPAGARVVRTDGVIVGVTPVTMKLDKGSAPLEVQLNLDGYRSEKRTITADLNRELDVNLLKAAGKRAATTKPAAAAGKPTETKPVETKKPVEAKPAKEEKPADPDKELIPAQL
jgi:hypothetical protein